MELWILLLTLSMCALSVAVVGSYQHIAKGAWRLDQLEARLHLLEQERPSTSEEV